MSKVIAVMDKPENCQKCVFVVCAYSLPLTIKKKGYYCQLKNPERKAAIVEEFDYDAEVQLSNCPLHELPEKKELYLCINSEKGYCEGYNACIDEILKRGEKHDK